jgi:hypothetical protein
MFSIVPVDFAAGFSGLLGVGVETTEGSESRREEVGTGVAEDGPENRKKGIIVWFDAQTKKT